METIKPVHIVFLMKYFWKHIFNASTKPNQLISQKKKKNYIPYMPTQTHWRYTPIPLLCPVVYVPNCTYIHLSLKIYTHWVHLYVHQQNDIGPSNTRQQKKGSIHSRYIIHHLPLCFLFFLYIIIYNIINVSHQRECIFH